LSQFPKEFHGLSVRIEDQVVIGQTEADSLILSSNAPKEVDDIEATMQGILEKRE
jgi:intermediate cleaving peptidase 55